MSEYESLAALRSRWLSAPGDEQIALEYLRRAVWEGTPPFVWPDAARISKSFPDALEVQWLYGIGS